MRDGVRDVEEQGALPARADPSVHKESLLSRCSQHFMDLVAKASCELKQILISALSLIEFWPLSPYYITLMYESKCLCSKTCSHSTRHRHTMAPGLCFCHEFLKQTPLLRPEVVTTPASQIRLIFS